MKILNSHIYFTVSSHVSIHFILDWMFLLRQRMAVEKFAQSIFGEVTRDKKAKACGDEGKLRS